MLKQNVTHLAHCFDVEIVGLVELVVPQDDLSIQDDHYCVVGRDRDELTFLLFHDF